MFSVGKLSPLCFFAAVLFSCSSNGSDRISTPATENYLTVDAGEDLVLEPDSEVVISGHAESSGGGNLSYAWEQPEGQSLELDDPSSREITIKVPVVSLPGAYALTLTVTDETGATASDSISITVALPKAPPKMVADVGRKRLLLPVDLDGLNQLSLSTAQDIPANGNLKLIQINNSPSTRVEFERAVAGDVFPVVVASVGDDGESVQEAWELVLTGLPIVHIRIDEAIVDEPKRLAEMTLIEPLKDDEHRVFTSHIGIEYRGGSSQSYAKKSLDIELWEDATRLQDEAEERKAELLGMREDGDWILDAMYIDYSRMRNRVSTDLWRDFSTMPDWSGSPSYSAGTSGTPVEVVLNDQYHGIYMLTETIDRKQLDIKDVKKGEVRGVLYKADNWGDVSGGSVSRFDADVQPPRDDQNRWYGWKLEYPSDPSSEAWRPLANLYAFVRSTSDEEFGSGIGGLVDLDNIIDYALLVNILRGTDNTGKNTFFAVYDQTSTEAKDSFVYYLPWDMDGTWGRIWNSAKDIHAGWLSNNLLNRIYATNPNDYRSRLKSRWESLRSTHFSQQQLMDRFKDYARTYFDSGAIDRENDRWGARLFDEKGADLDVELEILYLDSWIDDRLVWLDAYIEQNY